MHPNLESIFDEAENRYLSADELGLISQYVESLPGRLDSYRNLRDNELEIMQLVANDLQAQLPQSSVDVLERSVKNGLLILRYCAMGMLLNDETLIRDRLLGWLTELSKVYDTTEIDSVLFRLMHQHLGRMLPPQQMTLLAPMLEMVQSELLGETAQAPSAVGIGW